MESRRETNEERCVLFAYRLLKIVSTYDNTDMYASTHGSIVVCTYVPCIYSTPCISSVVSVCMKDENACTLAFHVLSPGLKELSNFVAAHQARLLTENNIHHCCKHV